MKKVQLWKSIALQKRRVGLNLWIGVDIGGGEVRIVYFFVEVINEQPLMHFVFAKIINYINSKFN